MEPAKIRPPRGLNKNMCEICHKRKAIKKEWRNPQEAPNGVGGTYRVCEKCEIN